MPRDIVVVAGIRSQYIKLASLQRAIRQLDVEERFFFIDAAQHYSPSLSAQYRNEYEINFHHSLLSDLTATDPEARFAEIEFRLFKLLCYLPVKQVVVFGDANTTLAAALAAKRSLKTLTHVEAGVRTGSRGLEEINRRVTDFLADHHVASCKLDLANLCAEGHEATSVYLGDLVRDLFLLGQGGDELPKAGSDSILVTLHHDEDWEDDFLTSALIELDRIGAQVNFLAHPKMLDKARTVASRLQRTSVRESTDHKTLVALMREARFVVTDSGALQRESHYLGRRVLVVQRLPFWRSLIDCGANIACEPTLSSLAHGLKVMKSLEGAPLLQISDFGEPPVGPKIVNWLLAAS